MEGAVIMGIRAKSKGLGLFLAFIGIFAMLSGALFDVSAESEKSPGPEYSQDKIMAVTLKKKQMRSEVMTVNIKGVKELPVRLALQPASGFSYAKALQTLKLPQLFIVDSEGKQLYTTDFFYPSQHTIPPLPALATFEFSPSVIDIADPEVTLVLPYFSKAKLLIVHDAAAVIMPVTKLIEHPSLPDTDPEGLGKDVTYKTAPAVSGKFNLLIMASRYDASNMAAFTAYVQGIKNLLFSISPFDQYIDKITINSYENTSSLGCYTNCAGITRLMCCDASLVTAAALSSGYPFDELIVVDSATEYAGGGYRDYGTYKNNSYSTFTAVSSGSWTPSMVLHEFGHSFGNLCDEYSYGTEGYAYYDCVNCRPSCSEFSLANACYLGCDAKPSYYRPDSSIMLSLNFTFYNQASIDANYSTDGLKQRLEYFSGQPVPCAYTISPTSQTFTSTGGTGSVTVNASIASCTWTATSSPSWATITSGASGTGNGAVVISVSANTTGAERTGNITIAGQTFTLTQSGATNCTYSISPANQSFTSTSGTSNITVTASDSSCAWTATSSLSWVTITSGSSGAGNGTVTISVAANTTGDTKTGNITIAGQTVVITQSAAGGSAVSLVTTTAQTSYSTIQAAYDANTATSGSTIKVQGTTLTETLVFNQNNTLTLTGGYDSTFTTVVGSTMTTVSGSLTISGGMVTVANLALQ